jgi:SNF2 family DNA or RNA helicase
VVIAPHKDGHLIAISDSKLGGGDFAKLAAFPGYFRWQERNAVFRTTGANIAHVIKHWPDAEWIGGCDKVRSDYLEQQGISAATARAKSDPAIVLDDGGYKYKRPPMDHQRKAFALSRDREAFGLFMEQGTGKTKVTIDTACWLFKKKEIDMMVVIAWPNGVHRNWVEYELPEDTSVPYVAEYWTPNWRAVHRQDSFRKFIQTKNKLKVFCFNVEAFVSDGAQKFLLELLNTQRVLLVIDQSASIKNPQAQRTKFLVNKAARLAKYRRVLDGAPVAEGASELFSQFKFLDPWIIGHDTWTGFKAEYCKIGYFNEIVGYQNLDELRQKIDGYCFRVRADDCLDLPPRIYKKWLFDLTPEERRIFDELKAQDLTTFKNGLLGEEEEETELLEEHNALVKNLRLQQISSGWWPQDGTTRMIDKETPARAQALMNLLASVEGQKAIIFSRFRADLDLMAKLLGDKAVSFHGGVKDEDRDLAKRRFMNDKKVLYFLGQPQSAGLGHTLTAARHVIFYANGHSLRLREECEKRAHRQGLKHRLFIWDLIGKATQDASIVRAFREKKELANVIMQDPDNFFLRYE